MRIGIDVGGMSIKIGIINDLHEIIAKKVILTNAGFLCPEEIIKNILCAVDSLLMEQHLTLEMCEQIGIAMPGTIDCENGVVLYSNNLQWKNVYILDELKKKWTVPVKISNDADSAVLGESICGAAKGYSNVVMLTLGTGVGGGVIINKEIFCGALRGGCELGHMVIKRNGKLCTCGRKGCFETYASATALMEQAKIKAKETPESLLNKFKSNTESEITGEIIFHAEKQGDLVAIKILTEYEENLSIGIANLINIFRPEIFILGGGISAQGSYLTDALQERVDKMCFGNKYTEVPSIVTAKLGNDAGIIGSAFL